MGTNLVDGSRPLLTDQTSSLSPENATRYTSTNEDAWARITMLFDQLQPNATSTSENPLLCLWNTRTYPWWQTLIYYAPRCILDADNSLGKRVTNILDGAKDIAQITANFTFMFFLWYMIRVPEKDAYHHYQTTVIAPIGIDVRPKTLREAVQANQSLLLALSAAQVEPQYEDEEYVEVTANKIGVEGLASFWIRKFDYNKIAREYKFQEAPPVA